jgi:hypothetical protein
LPEQVNHADRRQRHARDVVFVGRVEIANVEHDIRTALSGKRLH